ncbi:hypothetical protein Mapa_015070 [Marchantia paleacea]|nr:hypothetical protein Mapa_016186 [Marchantia paleacea]KAG6543576.1 hypothetical protein Mapa_015070 [Marchantia paleacea]
MSLALLLLVPFVGQGLLFATSSSSCSSQELTSPVHTGIADFQNKRANSPSDSATLSLPFPSAWPSLAWPCLALPYFA